MSGRRPPVVLVREPAAGAADAGLHLVEPEQRAVVGGDPPGGREVAVGRDDDAGLALDRLEEDGGGLVGDGVGQGRRRRRTGPR